MHGTIYLKDNLEFLKEQPSHSIDLIYIDPPFNTGKKQKRKTIKTVQDQQGHVGFAGKKYARKIQGEKEFCDQFEDFISFIKPRLEECHRILKQSGTLYFHIDYREVHYCKILLDQIFGRDCFLNEIIWAYDFGAKPKNRWPPKHDNILVYVKDKNNYIFNVNDIERIPYMSPGLAGEEKAKRGKLPTDVWWHTIVGTNSKEKTGYPTQKPLGILKRIIAASSPPEGLVLDCFAGSGTTGEAAFLLGRNFILVDNNPQAIETMKKRFEKYSMFVNFVEN